MSIRISRQSGISIVCGLLLVTLVQWVQNTEHSGTASFRERLEWIVYDVRLQASLPQQPPATLDQIVIVDFDEKSLQAEGQWPWPRDKIGQLIDKLKQAGSAVVAFDMVFAEPEANIAVQLSQTLPDHAPLTEQVRTYLNTIAPTVDNDSQFAQSLADFDVVLGYLFHAIGIDAGQLPTPLQLRTPVNFDQVTLSRLPNYTANLPSLQQAARGNGGFFSIIPDEDGIYRRAPLILYYNGALYPSLALETVRLYLFEDKAVTLSTFDVADQAFVEEVILGTGAGQRRIPTDGFGNVLIPFRGPRNSFPYISATDVLHERVSPELLAGAIVLVGTTAPGLLDLRATPVDKVYAGVEAHANMIAGLLATPTSAEQSTQQSRSPHIQFPYEPKWAEAANKVIILILGILLAIGFAFLPGLLIVLGAIAIVILLSYLNFSVWRSEGLVLDIVPAILMVITLAIFNLSYGFIAETKKRKQIKHKFGEYVPPELVEEMIEFPEQFSDQGDSRELTVLFADIRNFTTISESLSAHGLQTLLNRFFTPMTATIFKHHGTIDKYVGDMIMAFWGAPVSDQEHAINAVRAAFQMLREVEKLKPQFAAANYPPVNIGIGLNTGVMHVGNMGSQYRKAYTVLGDAVNLGSRLEGLTKYYGALIVVGEQTYAQAQSQFLFRRLDLVRVKGKSKAVQCYEPICELPADPRISQAVQRHETAIQHYLNQQWDAAESIFAALASEDPDTRIYSLYLERIAGLRDAELDANWDGVYERRTK